MYVTSCLPRALSNWFPLPRLGIHILQSEIFKVPAVAFIFLTGSLTLPAGGYIKRVSALLFRWPAGYAFNNHGRICGPYI